MTDHTEYRDITDHPGYRSGSNGSIWSCWAGGRYARIDPGKWHELKPFAVGRDPHKYLAVDLHGGNGKGTMLKVHSLVLTAFVGPMPEGMECRHLDGNKFNNRLDNLTWGTRKENMGDRLRHGTYHRGSRHCHAKLTEDRVREIWAARKDATLMELGERFGVHHVTILRILKREVWTHVSLRDIA
jgi:hypothetical protein